MDAWIVWVVVACILGFGEMHTGALYLLPFAIGAAVAAVVSVLGVGALLAVLIFVLASALMSERCAPWPGATADCLPRSEREPLR